MSSRPSGKQYISSMVVVVPSLLISYGLCTDLVSPRVEIRPKKLLVVG
jgi:hypothetical protein